MTFGDHIKAGAGKGFKHVSHAGKDIFKIGKETFKGIKGLEEKGVGLFNTLTNPIVFIGIGVVVLVVLLKR